jgi:glycosyltransferase involved in cell wall biosynthesis
VPIGDTNALGHAIARVLREPALAAALSAGAKARAPTFSIENTVSRTLDVYRELLGDRVPA